MPSRDMIAAVITSKPCDLWLKGWDQPCGGSFRRDPVRCGWVCSRCGRMVLTDLVAVLS